MKPITEQRRQELIADCEKEIEHAEKLLLSAGLAIGWRKVHENNLLKHQIVLASLNAVPVSEVISLSAPVLDGMIAPMNGYRGISNLAAIKRLPEGTKFYTAPPVPVIKFPDHEMRELVNEITVLAKKYADAQCLRDAISRVVADRLNGLGK